MIWWGYMTKENTHFMTESEKERKEGRGFPLSPLGAHANDLNLFTRPHYWI
jgi:hypothetical protein